MKKSLTTMALGLTLAAGPALADLTIPDLSYRTGPYAASGIPYSDGYQDYFTLINERDGGVGGERLNLIECETGYNTEKGVECYEATKGQGALLYQPLSTGITYQLIPKASADGIPIHTLGYGRTSAKNGKVFEWVFNYPANYWDGASVAVKHILDENDGDISDKTIALLYHNSAFGKEPIRTLEELSEKHGFTFTQLPIEPPGQEQKSQWLQIRRDQPDYVILYGWGVMNPVAIQEAANVRYPMDQMIGIWWAGSENDVAPAGARADGYKALAMHAVNADFPIYDDLQTYVVDKGLTAGAGDQLGSVLYNRGLYSAVLAVEAIRKAQELAGTSDITPAQMRDGMEALEMTEERMTELGLPGFGPSFKVTCENHGGDGLGAISQWDHERGTFELITDYMQSDTEVLDPLIEEDSLAYAEENNIDLRCQ
ncbi:branched-chain amino acid ABC transporter [Oceaniovalibus guishaninsula JLT2003]|uniref:Branched-chain amino acid ABC transporter n=1 Tax=Oceaniovalibus guishaninsula JLT2003 TaxID=1231392 RepID=K2I8C0_9RHOB|nr:ABC transporter substrate-binding protein [Oceaniovalibus guishaninsula]EKE45295.1 branched-chain amino acid ABC transporter [Oceaniovalibus guishaninsula JLT2003]